ncbi:MAG: hypothetical protein PHU44_13560 [Syntrophales bacterium]|nr:hypothetical protein [Syntrophales bacterium]MDD5641892.1 hypothetical protein [Syntrophales bacterium]
MSTTDAILAGIKEMVLPELAVLRQEQAEIKASVMLTNKRLDDVNTHLVDQSRRIDAVREELGGRIDAIREELGGRLDTLSVRLDDTNKRMDGLQANLVAGFDKNNERMDRLHNDLIARNDETNRAISRLYEVIVRREELQEMAHRLRLLEEKMAELEKRVAA